MEEASIGDVPGVSGAGEDDDTESDSGSGWMAACRTKFVGLDGKPLPPPPGGHDPPCR